MDTKLISKEWKLDPNDTIDSVFLDLLARDGDSQNYLASSDSLYPVIPSTSNISGPYLTPRKHLEYCTFWGGTSVIGLSSIFYVLFKLK